MLKHRQAFRSALLVAVLAIGAAACSASDDDDAVADEQESTADAGGETTDGGGGNDEADTTGAATTDDPAGEPTDTGSDTTDGGDGGSAGEMFGTMESPCGPGDATIAEGQNGDDGVLRLAAANDHDNEFSPGLTQEMLDASEAFADWCNEQGGIQGLQIEIIDLDGHIVEAAAAMERACNNAFAMVGGGLVLDDQEFPRFHECGMIDFAGYTVTAAKAVSDGMVQPIPNPPNEKPANWFLWGAEAFPEAVENTALLYGNIATTEIVARQVRPTMEYAGWTVNLEASYELGEANWAPFAQQLKDNEISALSFTGEPQNLALLTKAMDAVGYRPELILQEANFYDQKFLESAGESAEGIYVRTAYAPFDEPENYPAMQSYYDMMETYKPDGKIAGLGLQSTSAHLMFATAANECLDSNDGVLERECVLEAGKQITEWDGGGLHAPTDPSSNLPPECALIMQVVDGEWRRAFPEVGSEDDDLNGWYCPDGSIAEIEGDFGDLELGKDPDRGS